MSAIGAAPFLICVAHGDGAATEVPASSYAELRTLLGRMSAVCEKAGVPTPLTAIWRVDRGWPRPLVGAELEEGELAGLAILAG